jgi:Zn2+/Cd2+-exporting ATPase
MDARELEAALAEERRALRWSIAWTALTLVGLVGGVIAAWSGAEATAAAFYGLAYLAGGGPAGLEALRALARGRLEIDLLMVLAALAAAAVGEPRDGAILLFLFSLAETLEERAMGTTRRAVAALMRLRPDTARVLEGTDPTPARSRSPADEVAPGTRLRVRPGERMPLDGVVLEGASAVDQSPITGESVPVDKAAGDEVFAGTVNGHGALVVRTTKAATDSTLARMVRLVTEAQAAKAPSERFSDWFGQRYTVWVLIGTAASLAAFVAAGLGWETSFYRAATLLVVASPCAVVISVPAAVLSALAASARRGVLFKGGASLEALADVDTVAFDKTGTLTRAVMTVHEVETVDADEDELRRVAGALESASEHPIARAVVAWVRAHGGAPAVADDVTAEPGRGVSGSVDGRRFWAGNRRQLEAQGVDVARNRRLGLALDELEARGHTVVVVGEAATAAARRACSAGSGWPTRCARTPSRRCGGCARPACAASRCSRATTPPWRATWRRTSSSAPTTCSPTCSPRTRSSTSACSASGRRRLRGRRRQRRGRAGDRPGRHRHGRGRQRRGARDRRRRAAVRRPAPPGGGAAARPGRQAGDPAEPRLRARHHGASWSSPPSPGSCPCRWA